MNGVTIEEFLAFYKARTERLRVLTDFLARPIHAPGGTEPDPDIISAYNLSVEQVLRQVRLLAREG